MQKTIIIQKMYVNILTFNCIKMPSLTHGLAIQKGYVNCMRFQLEIFLKELPTCKYLVEKAEKTIM